MKKLYEIFKLLWIQKRIVAAATIWGNMVAAIWYILKSVIVQSGKLAGPYFLENVADNSMDIGGCKSFLMANSSL